MQFYNIKKQTKIYIMKHLLLKAFAVVVALEVITLLGVLIYSAITKL